MKVHFLRFLPALLILAAPSLQGAEFVVQNANDSGTGSLRKAVSDAVVTPEADTITFKSPEMNGAEIELVSGPFVITNPASIIINGESLTSSVTITPFASSRIFEIAAGSDLELVGLTLADGVAPVGMDGADGANPTAGGQGGNGGAIFSEGSVNLIRCLLEANSAGRGGDGGEKAEPDPGVSGNGGRGGHGGAIYSFGASSLVRLEQTTLRQNNAGAGGTAGDRSGGAGGSVGTPGKGGSGGAIYIEGGSLEVDLSTLENNIAGSGGTGGASVGGGNSGSGGSGGDGGAIALVDAALSLIDSTIKNNRAGAGSLGGNDPGGNDFPGAGGHGGDGGAIWAYRFPSSALPQVSGTYIASNQAGNGAKGGDTPQLGGVEVGTDGGNGGNGGALFLVGKAAANVVWTMTNTTIHGNFTGDGGIGGDGSASGTGGGGGDGGNGGGIAFSRDAANYTALLAHVTIYANNSGLPGQQGFPAGGGAGAGSSGGGIWEFPGGINSARGVTLANTVVAANDADTEPNIAPGFPSSGVNFTSGNPQMGIPANNGGPTVTIPPLRGSALVNGGGTITTPLLTDQRGAVRPFNGVPDIGAFEVALQPDLRVGASSNPATHLIDDLYSGTGAGQSIPLKFKSTRTANFYLSVQNDGEVADDLILDGTPANKTIKLTAIRLTGGPLNVTAQLRLGYEIADLLPDDVAVFQLSVKPKSKKKAAKQLLSYSVRTAGVPLPDTALVKVTQKTVTKKK
jgi:hypothetical protein